MHYFYKEMMHFGNEHLDICLRISAAFNLTILNIIKQEKIIN